MNEALNENFRHIRRLAKDIDKRFENATTEEQLLRNELAGMFAVTVAATYEGIVKETLISYAANFHSKYRDHIESDFGRLNARISIDDLRSYSQQFGLKKWVAPDASKNGTTFHRLLKEKREVVERRFRTDMVVNYKNLFTWRNDYAHERAISVTFRDVYEAHRVAQYVIRSFVDAFELG